MIVVTEGRVLTGEGVIQEGSVLIGNGRILDILPEGSLLPAGARVMRVNGALVLPGMVDLHGDAFERQLMPRPGVHIPLTAALMETDRQMLANGITTAYHGLTWSWEPGLRGREAALEFIAGLSRLRGGLLGCDTRLHLRHEMANLDAVEEIIALMQAGQIDLLAFNDHLDGIAGELREKPHKAGAYAARTGLAVSELLERVAFLQTRRDLIPPSRQRLAEAALACGVVIATHDDETSAFRREMHALGSQVSEFPVDVATARAARDLGNAVVLGAPNIVRGGSHCGRLNAADAVGDGLGTILVSDYYYPAMLLSVFHLARQDVCYLPDAWGLVSWNPAQAAGLQDRGRLAPGLRADVVVVDDSLADAPRVMATLVAGRCVYNALGLKAHGMVEALVGATA